LTAGDVTRTAAGGAPTVRAFTAIDVVDGMLPRDSRRPGRLVYVVIGILVVVTSFDPTNTIAGGCDSDPSVR
jgi:hypothetical protein